MKATLYKGSALPPEILEAWRRLQCTNPALASPYFAPGFTQALASVRHDVEVAVIEGIRGVEALLPFQRGRFHFGEPVGGAISDYQGVIALPDYSFDPLQLLDACGLVAWDFNHVVCIQTAFEPFIRDQHHSPIIDLSAGYEAYVKERCDAGTEQIKQCLRQMRRIERDVGPLRFVAHTPDRLVLEQMITWKTQQNLHNGRRDLFSIPWVRKSMEQLHATQMTDFGGLLSALYAGDQLIAVHFGLRSQTIWHYWFPTYDPAFSKYSPGMILLLKMAESASQQGVKMIDLGCGEHSYKSRLMNGSVRLGKGSVEKPCFATAARRVWTPVRKAPFRLRCWLAETPAGLAARRILRPSRFAPKRAAE